MGRGQILAFNLAPAVAWMLVAMRGAGLGPRRAAASARWLLVERYQRLEAER